MRRARARTGSCPGRCRRAACSACRRRRCTRGPGSRGRARAVSAPLNAVGSTIETAIPSASRAIACRIALTIWPTSLLVEPVHLTSTPRSDAASWLPFFAGTKNGLVSAWLTNTNRQRGCAAGSRRARRAASALRYGADRCGAGGETKQLAAVEALVHAGVRADEPERDEHERDGECRRRAPPRGAGTSRSGRPADTRRSAASRA